MNILFDISHPAHFHLFKNTIKGLHAKGVNILITARDKDVLLPLLNREGLRYYLLAKARQGYFGLSLELMARNVEMFRLCKHFKPDILIGTSVNITHVGKVIGKPSIVVIEDDDAVVPLFSYLTYPFAHRIVNPECITFNRWTQKRILHNSYHELAYLHPDNFEPDINVIKKYGLTEKEYIIARFSALRAHHDVGAAGISRDLWGKIKKLTYTQQVIRSFESETSHQIAPWDMHHLLAFAKMIVSDSQTMTIEGSVLGVPSVRINTFVGKSTVIEELEKQYQLAFGFLPDQETVILRTIQSILANSDTGTLWKKRRAFMLSEKADFNQWLLCYINRELQTI